MPMLLCDYQSFIKESFLLTYFLLVLIELFSLGFTAEALRAKIARKSAISLQRGQFDSKFQVEGVAPPIIFARLVRPMNALQPCC